MSFLLNPHISFGGFSPSDIAGLRVWFDAQDNATITVTDTDKCNVWASKLGSVTMNMVPPAPNPEKPIIGDVSGKQMLEFSSARYLSGGISTNLSPGTGPMTIVTVARTTATARSHICYLGPSGTAVIQTRFNNSASDGAHVGQLRDSAGGVNRMLWVDTDVDHADGAVRVHLASRVGGGSSGALYIDNVASSLNPIADTSGAISDNLGNMFFGRTSTGTETLTGHIGEILIYHAELTVDERTDLYDYLAAKWGL